MAAYYNEFDPYAAQWLRNLIAENMIAAGDVDERSIVNVKADEIRKYTQCHFFAGIGGWQFALRLAGWPDERPVWTGSCPCQPFSVAGKGWAQSDERHLWPAWFSLIRESKPSIIFGEQVGGAIAHGWLDDVYQGLEGEGYAVGSATLPACGVGAPHRRDRLWFVADSSFGRFDQPREGEIQQPGRTETFSTSEDVANADDKRLERWNSGKLQECSGKQSIGQSDSLMADTPSGGEQRSGAQCNIGGFQEAFLRKGWNSHDWYIEPSVGRVANGVPARSHKLRAYGNAIVPQVAAEFIKAFMECRP